MFGNGFTGEFSPSSSRGLGEAEQSANTQTLLPFLEAKATFAFFQSSRRVFYCLNLSKTILSGFALISTLWPLIGAFYQFPCTLLWQTFLNVPLLGPSVLRLNLHCSLLQTFPLVSKAWDSRWQILSIKVKKTSSTSAFPMFSFISLWLVVCLQKPFLLPFMSLNTCLKTEVQSQSQSPLFHSSCTQQ